MKKLEFQIDYNMNNVDNAIIPNLKEIVLKIADLKKTIGLLQTKQGKLVEEEDRLLNELDGLQNSFRSRITNVYENEVFYIKSHIFFLNG